MRPSLVLCIAACAEAPPPPEPCAAGESACGSLCEPTVRTTVRGSLAELLDPDRETPAPVAGAAVRLIDPLDLALGTAPVPMAETVVASDGTFELAGADVTCATVGVLLDIDDAGDDDDFVRTIFPAAEGRPTTEVDIPGRVLSQQSEAVLNGFLQLGRDAIERGTVLVLVLDGPPNYQPVPGAVLSSSSPMSIYYPRLFPVLGGRGDSTDESGFALLLDVEQDGLRIPEVQVTPPSGSALAWSPLQVGAPLAGTVFVLPALPTP